MRKKAKAAADKTSSNISLLLFLFQFPFFLFFFFLILFFFFYFVHLFVHIFSKLLTVIFLFYFFYFRLLAGATKCSKSGIEDKKRTAEEIKATCCEHIFFGVVKSYFSAALGWKMEEQDYEVNTLLQIHFLIDFSFLLGFGCCSCC